MIKTTTNFLNATLINNSQENSSAFYFNKDAKMFYNLLIPRLNALVKMPSKKSVDNILKFSKSM